MGYNQIINTKDSTTRGAYSRDGNTWNVDGQQIDSYTEQLRGMEQQLPANEGSDGVINWLGSSFSGADIKLVVHMYEDIDVEEEGFLREDQAFYVELVDAFNTLYSVVDTVAADGTGSYEIFYGLFGKAADPRVIDHIQSFVITFSGLSPAVRASTMRAAIDANIQEYQALSESAGNQLADIDAITKDQHSTFTLATAQTFSIQTHREKHPVRALGYSNVKGYTRGARTCAGSIIFTMFNEHALASLIRKMGNARNKYDPSPSGENDISSLLIDQLPPLDITIVFANEYGSLSRGAVYGVEFINNGVTLSIEDIITEEVVNFVARDVDPVISLGRVGIDRKQRGMHFNREGRPATGSNLIIASKTQYNEYLKKLKVRRNLRNR